MPLNSLLIKSGEFLRAVKGRRHVEASTAYGASLSLPPWVAWDVEDTLLIEASPYTQEWDC